MRISLVFGFILSLSIGFMSGWRDFGLDRVEYIEMYNGIINSDDWSLKIWFAKDLFNLCVVSLANYFSEDPRYAFLITCTLSLYLKYRASVKVSPRHTVLVVVLYGFLLSPGLEFAAMRSGLAIGFVMLATVNTANKMKFYLLCTLAVLSHISMVAVVVFMIPAMNRFLQKNSLVFASIAAGPLVVSNFLTEISTHGAAYKGTHGTVFAYILPFVTLVIAWLIFFGRDKVFSVSRSTHGFDYKYIGTLVFSLIAISFGFTATIVQAATRYLEVAWCLMLFASVMRWRQSVYNFSGFILLILFLCALNVERSTWLAIIDPDFSL